MDRVTNWPSLPYDEWRETRDTLHSHVQVLGKLAATLAPPEPELQHAALRLTARGWETLPLPDTAGSGVLVVAVDLHLHQVVLEHSNGRRSAVALTPNRPVATVTKEVISAARSLAGPISFDPTPQETPWTTPLNEDLEHATYDTDAVSTYFGFATRAARALARARAPFRGRSTPVNAWWGSFDLAVNLFSGAPADPPSSDFIMRNAMDAQEVAIGWWPGDHRYPRAAFYAYAHPAPPRYEELELRPSAARWEPTLGEFVLDWDDVRDAEDPERTALDFLTSAVQHSCTVCGWEPEPSAACKETRRR